MTGCTCLIEIMECSINHFIHFPYGFMGWCANEAKCMRDGDPVAVWIARHGDLRGEESRSQWSGWRLAWRCACLLMMQLLRVRQSALVADRMADGPLITDRRATEIRIRPSSPSLPLVTVFHCTALHCAKRTHSIEYIHIARLDAPHMAASAAAADGSALSLSAAAAAQPAAAPTGASSSSTAPSLLERALADEATEWSAIHPNTQRLAARGLTRSVLLPDVSVAVAGRDLLSLTTLRFMDGHKYGLVGQNGCGKSTLLRRIASGQIGGWPKHLRCHLVQVSPTAIRGGQRTGEDERDWHD